MMDKGGKKKKKKEKKRERRKRRTTLTNIMQVCSFPFYNFYLIVLRLMISILMLDIDVSCRGGEMFWSGILMCLVI